MTPSVLFKSCTLGALLAATMAAAQAAPTAYVFKPLVPHDALGKPPSLTEPALSPDGSAAFVAKIGGVATGLLRTGSRPAVIARKHRFSRFGDVAINARGQVAFEASLAQVRGEGIFRGNGRYAVQVAGTRDAGDFDFVNAGPSINAAGRVAFIGERIVGGQFVAGVWSGTGAAPAQAVYDVSGPFAGFTGNPSINDAGVVAFVGTLDDGTGGLFMGAGGDTFVTVADERGPLTSIYGFSDPSLNDRGEVAFSAGTNEDPDDDSGSTGTGIFLYSGGVLRTVIQGDFTRFASLGQPSLNNLGRVAFVVEPQFGQQVLVTGPDLVEDRVVGTGDRLAGREVAGIVFSREGFNDAGQLAFVAYFTDGSSGVFLATPAARAR